MFTRLSFGGLARLPKAGKPQAWFTRRASCPPSLWRSGGLARPPRAKHNLDSF